MSESLSSDLSYCFLYIKFLWQLNFQASIHTGATLAPFFEQRAEQIFAQRFCIASVRVQDAESEGFDTTPPPTLALTPVVLEHEVGKPRATRTAR